MAFKDEQNYYPNLLQQDNSQPEITLSLMDRYS